MDTLLFGLLLVLFSTFGADLRAHRQDVRRARDEWRRSCCCHQHYSNIVALAEFSYEVVSQIKEYGENAHEVPKSFRDIKAVLPIISSTLIRTRDQVENRSLEDDTCKALRPVLEMGESKLKELKLIFNDAIAPEGASKFKRGLIAIKSI